MPRRPGSPYARSIAPLFPHIGNRDLTTSNNQNLRTLARLKRNPQQPGPFCAEAYGVNQSDDSVDFGSTTDASHIPPWDYGSAIDTNQPRPISPKIPNLLYRIGLISTTTSQGSPEPRCRQTFANLRSSHPAPSEVHHATRPRAHAVPSQMNGESFPPSYLTHLSALSSLRDLRSDPSDSTTEADFDPFNPNSPSRLRRPQPIPKNPEPTKSEPLNGWTPAEFDAHIARMGFHGRKRKQEQIEIDAKARRSVQNFSYGGSRIYSR